MLSYYNRKRFEIQYWLPAAGEYAQPAELQGLPRGPGERLIKNLSRKERMTLGGALAASVLAGGLSQAHGQAVLVFVVSGVALALLAMVVGQATEQIGERLSAGATGVLQSALGSTFRRSS